MRRHGNEEDLVPGLCEAQQVEDDAAKAAATAASRELSDQSYNENVPI